MGVRNEVDEDRPGNTLSTLNAVFKQEFLSRPPSSHMRGDVVKDPISKHLCEVLAQDLLGRDAKPGHMLLVHKTVAEIHSHIANKGRNIIGNDEKLVLTLPQR